MASEGGERRSTDLTTLTSLGSQESLLTRQQPHEYAYHNRQIVFT